MSTDEQTNNTEWEQILPAVNAEAEFLEILNDFGNPLEIVREGISNAIDAHATWIEISFEVKRIDGVFRLVITLFDNGEGIHFDILKRDFWGLGFSPSRDQTNAIGEKGHGTKIYLRSERVEVKTQNALTAHHSICDRPLEALASGKLHQPEIRTIDKFMGHTGTRITITGYNDNERSRFRQDIVKDYLLWFTKVGSIEKIFGISPLANFEVRLKCLGQDDFETIPFGHPFPPENLNLKKLFDDLGTSAGRFYVKRHIWKDYLVQHPEVKYEAVIYVEGDGAKQEYNPMIRQRLRQESKDSGKYRVRDRYGIWLCKDYIPVKNVTDWVTSFGTGTGSVVLLHGFVNCQALSLTANRGDIANTDPKILDELQSVVEKLALEVDDHNKEQGLYTIHTWDDEEKTLKQEKKDYTNRTKSLKNRHIARLDERILLEPKNESELFGLLITVFTLRPEIFKFQPLDYNTTRGIDIIAQDRSSSSLSPDDYSYMTPVKKG